MKKELDFFIKDAFKKGYSKEEIRSSLLQQGWGEKDISEALRADDRMQELKAIAPKPKSKSEWSINLREITISQILLYLGGIIVFIAGITFIGISWQAWNSVVRMAVMFIATSLMLGVGMGLRSEANYRKQALMFLFVGALLFPLFVGVVFYEMEWFSDVAEVNYLTFLISLLALVLYIVLNYAFRSSIWTLLHITAGAVAFYSLLLTLGISGITTKALLMFLLGVSYMGYGYFLEEKGDSRRGAFPYLVGSVILIGSSLFLISNGWPMRFIAGIDLAQASIEDIKFIGGWSAVIFGVVFAMASYFMEKVNLKQLNIFSYRYNFIGVMGAMLGIFILGLDGNEFLYETSLLIASVGLIFGSVYRKSRIFLYLGTLFLVVYIFSIGGEYFQNQVGWPATLFVAGLISMGVGIGAGKLRKMFLPKRLQRPIAK